jgi:hypothetical protein
MKGVTSCTATDDETAAHRYLNKIINGGCKTEKNTIPYCPKAMTSDGKDNTISPCQMAHADFVFMYNGFLFALAMIFMVYLLARRGRGGTPTPMPHRRRANTPIPSNAYA